MPPSDPPPPADPSPTREEALLEALLAFVNSRDWAAARAIFDEHPDLQSAAADRTLGALLTSSRAAGDEQTAAMLGIRRNALRQAGRVGADEAFRQAEANEEVAALEALLNVIATNTLLVLTRLPDKQAAWRQAVAEIEADAREDVDEDLARLARAVSALLSGEEVRVPRVPAGSLYQAAWEDIVGGLVEHARRAAHDDMFAVIAHNVRYALAGGLPEPAYWASYFANVGRMAEDLGDADLSALAGALVGLLEAGSPAGMSPELRGPYAACWQTIVEGLPTPGEEREG